MTRFAAIFFLCALPLFCQSNSGELRLKVTDPAGLAVKTTVKITSEANQYRNTLTTNDQGKLDVQRLPYGIYQLEISQPGFAEISQSVNIHSLFPTEYAIQLLLPTVKQSANVSAASTLIDPDQPGAVNHVGSDDIQTRLSSIPGRSLQDLVNSQPGWLYEGNAVLHPRGDVYKRQMEILFVSCNPVGCNVALSRWQIELTRADQFVKAFFQGILDARIPRLRRIGLWPKILDVFRTTESRGNQVVDLIVVRTRIHDSVLLKDLLA